MRTSARHETGQAAVLVVGLSVVAFAVAGLAVDGTRAFLYRRTLQNAADSAALAGAGELDAATLYSGGGTKLDPNAAERAAGVWLVQRDLAVQADVSASPTNVRVVVRGTVSTTFLAAVGIADLPVAAEAHAEPLDAGPGAP